ncbi:hypothetical protein COEREDRAFT_83364 [Coemansia reversa NRRL 1564]|uniref:Uncharacterized protein n=1 Tax=Coemansia reversa (strain ATCC 12441 / NRRL 1564) TaxID=763665 RepID=A0A2G5B3R3_COERN|nr:hypothetical protein COEREDRAFT_83364 [Coemansia reversa NRRL 1564]|eukprot:PIA13673.1 hypothetical protein COEREDRAFT_83364 [Coemansia reversa NRRL 1564]
MEYDAKTFKAFEAYDFDNDKTFQAGLSNIPNSSDALQLLKAKAFYYSKIVAPIDLSKYEGWKSSQKVDKTTGTTSISEQTQNNNHCGQLSGAPYSASFAEVVGMIMRGEEIPGAREIPDELNTESPSRSAAKAPPKPWERETNH